MAPISGKIRAVPSKARKPTPTRTHMQAVVKEALAEFELDDLLENFGVNRVDSLSLRDLKDVYQQIQEDYPASAVMTNTSTKEKTVEKFTAEVIEDRKTRTVAIYVEDKDGKFLMKDGTRQDRPLGGEMPMYDKMPLEVYNAIVSAA